MQATVFFKALSDATRLKLIYILRENGSLCVCNLTDILNQPQPTISRHLNHLKRAGLLISERRGTWMWYELNKAMPQWCRHVIEFIEMDDSIKIDTIDVIDVDVSLKCC